MDKTISTKKMKFNTLVPNIFYADIKVDLNVFVECLGFRITYNDLETAAQPFCVIERDGLKLHLIQSAEFADKDRPEIRLETNDINEVYTSVKENFPQLIHPNAKVIKLQPWKVKEFALRDESGVCIIIQEWVN